MIASRGDVWLSTRWIRIVAVSAALVALVASGSLSSAAPSETEPLRIEATAPESCPARPTLGDRIRSHTSRVREAKAGERARALHVTITSEADRFVAQLRLVEDGEALERRVPGKTCEEVLAAVALITALAIDPLASAVPTDAGAPQEIEIVDAAPDARAPVVTEVDAGPPAPLRSPLHARFGVSLEAYGLGQVVLGRGVWIEGALTTRAAPALRLKVTRTQSFTEERDLRPAFFQLTTLALDGCITALRTKAELDTSTLELRPCAQVAGGVLEGSSAAFGSVHDMPRPWFSLGAMLQARWRVIGPLELEAALGLTLPLVRDNFFFLPQSDVYRAPGVVFLGNVGVGTTFR